MVRNRRDERILLFLFIFGFLLRTFWVLYFQANWPQRAISFDSFSYLNSAKALLQDHKFNLYPGSNEPMFLRTPGYPLFITSFFVIFGIKITPILLGQVVASLFAVWLSRKLGMVLFSSEIALLTAALLVVEPLQLLATGQILTECLDTLFVSSMAFTGASALRQRNPSLSVWLVLGIVTILATFIRPTTYYFPVIVVFLIGVHSYINRISVKRTLSSACIYLLPVVLLSGAWQFRNYKVTQSWNISGIEDLALYTYRAASIHAQIHGIRHVDAKDELTNAIKRTPGEPEGLFLKRMRAKGLEIILSHPKEFVVSIGKGIVSELYGMATYIEVKTQWVCIFAWICLTIFYALFAAGVIFSLWKEERLPHIYVLTIFAYILILSADLGSNARFRVPLMPILCFYAAVGIHRIRNLRGFRPVHIDELVNA